MEGREGRGEHRHPSHPSQPQPQQHNGVSFNQQNGGGQRVQAQQIKGGGSRSRGQSQELAKSPSDLSHVPCKFYRQGGCQAGTACPFSHNLDPSADTAPCKYFSKGNCKFGSKCMLAHILPDGRRVNPRYTPNSQTTNSSHNHHLASHHPHHHHHPGQFQRIIPESTNQFAPPRSALHSSLLQANMVQSHSESDSVRLEGSSGLDEEPRRSSVLGPLDAVLPASLDSNGISYFARHGPMAASVPTKFGFGSPVSEQSEQSRSQQRHYLKMSPFGTTPSLAIEGKGLASSSFPAHGALLWNDYADPHERDSGAHFAFEEDFVPSSLQRVLTPIERRRKADVTGGSSSSSPSSGSRFGALFERHKRDEIVGSPLRHTRSSLHSPIGISPPTMTTSAKADVPNSPLLKPIARSGDATLFPYSPPSGMTPLSSSRKTPVDRSELHADASTWVPKGASQATPQADGNEAIPGPIIIDDEQPFFMEEDVVAKINGLST